MDITEQAAIGRVDIVRTTPHATQAQDFALVAAKVVGRETTVSRVSEQQTIVLKNISLHLQLISQKKRTFLCWTNKHCKDNTNDKKNEWLFKLNEKNEG